MADTTIKILYGDIFVSESINMLHKKDKERLMRAIPGLNFPVDDEHIIKFGRHSRTCEAVNRDVSWARKSLCIFSSYDTLPVGWETDSVIYYERTLVMAEGWEVSIINKNIPMCSTMLMHRGRMCRDAEHIELQLVEKGFSCHV